MTKITHKKIQDRSDCANRINKKIAHTKSRIVSHKIENNNQAAVTGDSINTNNTHTHTVIPYHPVTPPTSLVKAAPQVESPPIPPAPAPVEHTEVPHPQPSQLPQAGGGISWLVIPILGAVIAAVIRARMA